MPTESRIPVSRRKLGIFGVLVAAAGLTVVVSGIRAREESSVKLREWTNDQAVPSVAVIYAAPGALTATIDLPGRLEAYYRAPIFARVNGYLKNWNADIGARVKAGEVIAEIDAPDLDQQLLQARADLANKNAAVNASQANVERLEALAGYKKITAPFEGIVTARNTDVGALINAGGGSSPPMFVVSDIKKLRVYVNVPQNYVPSVKIGAKAIISVPEYPTRTFDASMEASSQAVDVNSGTTQMQLALDNPASELMPGGFANVRLVLQREGVPLHIPASALVFDQKGLRVATVTAGDRILFKHVTIAHDLGRDIELSGGITLEDRIINSPPDGMIDGDQVRVVSTKGRPATVSTKQGDKG